MFAGEENFRADRRCLVRLGEQLQGSERYGARAADTNVDVVRDLRQFAGILSRV